MKKYQNRIEAGKILASSLQTFANDPNVLVLALPRGGIPVAYSIAESLSVSLDVFIVRKLGVPGYKELAFGAVVMDGITIFNEDVIQTLGISQQEIDHTILLEQQELKKRQENYRGSRPFPDLKNKKLIIVDDGIATGATMRAAINTLRKLGATYIVVAVPVVAKSIYNTIIPLVNNIICPLQPIDFYSVGEHYIDFTQITNTEIHQLLNNKFFSGHISSFIDDISQRRNT